jgi:branched-chain amino acid transport system substrate-binding protein
MNKQTWIKLFGIATLIATTTASCSFLNKTTTTDKNNIVKIGAILPMTGPTGYLGEGESLGVKLAMAERKPTDPKIDFVFEDSKGKPDVALSAMQKLLNVENIKIHVVSTTAPVQATLPAYKSSGKDVLVIAQAMVPSVTKDYPFAYRLYATSDEETDLLAAYAKEKGFKKIGALHINNRFGQEGVNFFKRKVKGYGADVTLIESFSFSDKDFKTILAKMKGMKVDALLIYAYSDSFPTIFQQMQEAGLKVPVMGNADLALGGLSKKVSADFLKNVTFPAPRYYFAKNDPRVEAFNSKVKAQGKEANFDIAYFYDMTNILTKAIDKTPSKSPKDIAASIESLMPYQGVTGLIRLNEYRDTRADMKLVHWDKGALQVVELKVPALVTK